MLAVSKIYSPSDIPVKEIQSAYQNKGVCILVEDGQVKDCFIEEGEPSNERCKK